MTAAPGQRPPCLDLLERSPERFELFQAIRLLEAAGFVRARDEDARMPPAVGGRDHGTVSEAAIRFRSAATLGFPHGAVTAVRRPPPVDDGPAGTIDVELSCFGLIGPGGPLPRHYTSLVVERVRRHRDTALRDFLDVFVQRLAAEFYAAWAKYRQPVQYERTRLSGRSASWDESATSPRDGVTAVIASLVGLGTAGLTDRVRGGDDTVLRYAAHYARQSKCPESLERLLTDAFGVPARVEPFVGRWLELEPGDQSALASRGRPEGLNCRLGEGALAGRRAWDVTSTFEVVVGPLTAAAFADRLPGQPTLSTIGDLARLYVGPEFEIRVRLVLRGADVPRCRLGGRGDAESGLGASRLGWTTWLGSQHPAGDRDDAVFRVR